MIARPSVLNARLNETTAGVASPSTPFTLSGANSFDVGGGSVVRYVWTLLETGAGRVLVTTNGHLEGIISASDVVQWARRAQELGEMKVG